MKMPSRLDILRRGLFNGAFLGARGDWLRRGEQNGDMGSNNYGVDVEEALANMAKEGVPFGQVTVFYSDLAGEELKLLKEKGLFHEETGAVVLGLISENGEVLFPEKVSGFYSLGA